MNSSEIANNSPFMYTADDYSDSSEQMAGGQPSYISHRRPLHSPQFCHRSVSENVCF